MNVPEKAIAEGSEEAYSPVAADVDLRIATAGVHTVVRPEVESPDAQIFDLDEARSRARGEQETTTLDNGRQIDAGDEEPAGSPASRIPSILDPLQAELAKRRRERNAEPDTYTSVRTQPVSAPAGLLGQESQDALFARLEDGNQQAKRELVERHLPLALSIALKYAGEQVPFEDLLQVARGGLVKSVDRFDRSRGFTFSTFAHPTIDGELKRHFRDYGWAMHVPRSLQERAAKVKSVVYSFEQKDKEWTFEEVAQELDISVEQAAKAYLASDEAHFFKSLDARVSGEDSEMVLGDKIGDPQALAKFEGALMLSGMLSAMGRLCPDMRVVVIGVMEGRRQKDIADYIGVSPMKVSRLLRDATALLAEDLNQEA